MQRCESDKRPGVGAVLGGAGEEVGEKGREVSILPKYRLTTIQVGIDQPKLLG